MTKNPIKFLSNLTRKLMAYFNDQKQDESVITSSNS